MNEEFWRWYMYGHWVCLTQWLGFIMVEYAYLGKGRVKHPLVWSCIITVLTMTLSVVRNHGFFTPMAVVYTLLFLFITVMLFGGTPGQKFTACLINGTMCLLVENSVRYVISWVLKCELQQVIQRADCLIIMSFANLVVSTGVSFFVGKWRRYNALEPLQALTMSFFPGVVVVLNILLMLTDNNKRATMATMGMTVGLDFGFLGGRINGSVDWYLRQTDDLLNSVITPMGSNFGNTVLTNIGSMENKGVEFNLNFIPVQTKDWNLTVGFNGTFQHTEFTKLNNTDDPDYNIQTGSITKGTGNLLQIHKVGYAPYTFYCFQQVYDQDGNPIQNALVDRDKDGKITQADRYMTDKSPNPDFFYGISLKLNYKNWDFGFNGHGSAGNWVFNDFASANSTSNIDINAGNLPNFARLVKKTGFTKANSGEQWYSDMFLENASFFRMDDINLGYTFNKIGNWKGSMRVAFGVQNVFVITDYSGVDPEIPGVNGIDGSIWPRPRTYSLRLNVNF